MNKNEIQEALDALQKVSRRLKKKAAELASAQQDAAQFEQDLEAIGRPHYKDTAKIKRKAELQFQLESCNEAINEPPCETETYGTQTNTVSGYNTINLSPAR